MVSIIVLTFNRLGNLQNCLTSIENYTTAPHEIIVVNNASTDGTKEFLDSKKSSMFHSIHLDQNFGVTARNYGFKFASGNHIAQIDDDVQVYPGWDQKCFETFSLDPLIGIVGQQGGLIKTWMDIHTHINHSRNGYVDCITGFCMMMKNVGIYYDEALSPFWHEELDLAMQFKYMGFKLFKIDGLCVHHHARTAPVDWDLHNRNLQYVHDKWALLQDKLSLGGF